MIRESVLDDVPAFARIRYAMLPWMTASVAAQRNWFTSLPERARGLRLTAEVDGEVVAFASGGFNTHTKEPNAATAWVSVHPDHRRRGLGSALLDQIEAHLREIGAGRAQAFALDDPIALAWAERKGWRKGASSRFSSVDPRNLPPQPATPSGVTVASLHNVDPKIVYDIDQRAGEDEPGDMGYSQPFDLWLTRVWNGPDLDRDASLVALVDGEPAALTVVEVNAELGRAWAGGTSTLREYRGRGLAKLLKSISLRKLAEMGVTSALTSNDYTNAPMLAINDWLGYKVIATEYSLLKDFQ